MALASLAIACKGDDNDFDAAALQPVLERSALALADLPDDWSENAALAPPAAEPGEPIFGYCNQQLAATPAASVQAGFQRTAQGPFVITAVRAFADDGATRFMEQMSDIATECRRWSQRDDRGTTSEWTLAPLPDASADGAVAFHVAVTYADGLSQTSHVVLSHAGQFVTELVHGARADVTVLDLALTQELSTIARERLEAAVSEASAGS
ncbi:MAG: hypothetical protein WD359_09685 [Dehalococcoidia bacterium]